jgi:cell division protein FtsW
MVSNPFGYFISASAFAALVLFCFCSVICLKQERKLILFSLKRIMATCVYNTNVYFAIKFFDNSINICNDNNVSFIGRYPLKYIGVIVGQVFVFGFVLIAKAFPVFNNRVSTWESRIESYFQMPRRR